MAKKLQPETALTIYLLKMKSGGEQKITVPSSFKVTFGPICPGSKNGSYNSSGGLALRVYDGIVQRAVFMDVEAFRDMSINIEEKVTTTKQETITKETPEGEKHFVVEAKVSEWRNPDKIHQPGTEFLALPRTLLPE